MVADLRTTKLDFERSLVPLQEALVKLSTQKDIAREKIMTTTLIQKQKLEAQQVPVCPFIANCVLLGQVRTFHILFDSNPPVAY